MMRNWLATVVVLTVSFGLIQEADAGRHHHGNAGRPQASLQDVWDDVAEDFVLHWVKPSEADPAVANFDEPNVVLFGKEAKAEAPLAVFMPGTKGMPANAPLLLQTIAGQGYRVIGLEYNDEPAVVQVCPRDPDPGCSEKFRQKRIFGDDVTNAVDNSKAEAIVTRLVKLLQYLDARYPDEHWGTYLAGGEPDWSKIAVSGLSQGAGMAAYIAKKRLVRRVVLFSSPWDFTGRDRQLAPWIAAPSLTPPERWYAEYHQRENTAGLLAQSYKLLGIPDSHVLVFDGEPPNANGPNPYHGSTIKLPVYVPQWKTLFGTAQ